ncbi:MAG: hypothetical protein WEC12_07890 [Balneolaceae bacterium]
MKGFKILVLIMSLSVFYAESKAQTPQVLGGNLLNGAVTGSILGAASMGLNNSGDFAPVRIGVGAGILGGAGIAVYDLVSLPMGEQFHISGVFNDGNNSSIIILLDTFYGAASGAMIGTAGMLVADRGLVEGLQYGASAGAWTGFAFGLVDAFLLSERNRDFIASELLDRESIVAVTSEHYHLGLIQPAAFSMAEISASDITTALEPVLGVLSLRMTF